MAVLAAFAKCGLRCSQALIRPSVCGFHRSIKPDATNAAVELQESTLSGKDSQGATSPVPDPLEHPDLFGVREMFTLEDLFDARIHFGHKFGVRNKYMQPYLFGNRLGVDIIDLEKTIPMLGDALNFAAHIAYRRGVILFLSRSQHLMPLIEKTASDCGEYSHCRKWRGGTFSNATKVFQAITRLPDLCIFISTHNTVFDQHPAIVEATKLNIPTVGIADSSCDPRLITYPVPGNDDTPCAVKLYCHLFSEAIQRGKQKQKEHEEE